MQTTVHITPRLRTLVMAAALCAAPLAAHATAAISLTAVETLGASSGPGTNVMTVLPSSGGDFFHANAADGNTTFFHVYGYSGALTYFGARASGTGTFFSKTSAGYTDSITNNSGVAQMVVFSFNVDSGQLGVSGSGTGYADLSLNLMFDGVTMAREHGRVDYDSGATSSCVVNDMDVGVLGGYLSCTGDKTATGAFGAYSVSQLLADGATLNVAYDIVAEISGTLSGDVQTFCSGGKGDLKGQGLAQPASANDGGNGGKPGESGCVNFNSIARSGDPAGFAPFNPGTPGQFSLSLNAVPEPASLPLLALALGALAVARRAKLPPA